MPGCDISELLYIPLYYQPLPSQCQPVWNSTFILSLCYCRRRETLSVCKNFSSQICFILSMTFSLLSLAVSVCFLLLQWLLLTLSAHLDFTCHPSVYFLFFTHLLLVVPIWVCVKYSSFCLLLCHTHTQNFISYFLNYIFIISFNINEKEANTNWRKKMFIPFLIQHPHSSFTFTLKS